MVGVPRRRPGASPSFRACLSLVRSFAANKRIAGHQAERHQRNFSPVARFVCTVAFLFVAMFAAERFGLVDLISKGYRALAWLVLITYVLPLMTFGLWRLAKGRTPTAASA